jgi:hypothetical protein
MLQDLTKAPLEIISEGVRILSMIITGKKAPPSVLLLLGIFTTRPSGKYIAFPWSILDVLPKLDFPMQHLTCSVPEVGIDYILPMILSALESIDGRLRPNLSVLESLDRRCRPQWEEITKSKRACERHTYYNFSWTASQLSSYLRVSQAKLII